PVRARPPLQQWPGRVQAPSRDVRDEATLPEGAAGGPCKGHATQRGTPRSVGPRGNCEPPLSKPSPRGRHESAPAEFVPEP
ncbi:unnamed protein product, partial [Symbiodinium necroappetens]